ncbi:hypothetical protein SGLAM104S_00101 [Streptomyces glaucescens]
MDGASEWRIFTRIALPMMVPGLVTGFWSLDLLSGAVKS